MFITNKVIDTDIDNNKKVYLNDYIIFLDDNEILMDNDNCITIIFNYRYGDYRTIEAFLSCEDVSKKLKGVYCILQIQKDTNKLQVINDALGCSQIYLYSTGNTLMITNHMESFKKIKIPLTKNLEYYYDYLTSAFSRERFICSENTPFNEINRVGAGEIYTYSERTFSAQAWWSLETISYANKYHCYLSAKREFEQILDRICDDISRNNDMNILILLSAGIDSNLILHYLCKKNLSQHIIAVIFKVTGDTNDECWDAQKSALDAGVKKIIMIDEGFDRIGPFSKKNDQLPNEPTIQSLYNNKIELLKNICDKEKCNVIIDGDGGDHLFEIKYGYLRDYVLKKKYLQLFILKLFWQNKDVSYDRAVSYSKRTRNLFPQIGPKWLRPNKMMLRLYDKRKEQTKGDLDLELYKYDFYKQIRKTLYSFSDITHWGNDIRYISPYFDRELIEFVAQLPEWILWTKGVNKGFIRRFGKTFVPKYINEIHKKRNVPGDLRKSISNAINLITEELLKYSKNDKTVISKILIDNTIDFSNGIKLVNDEFDAINRYISINRYYNIYYDNNI